MGTRSIGYYPKFRVSTNITVDTRNTQKYPKIPENTRNYPKIPEIPENTRKYPRVKEIPGNTRSYISTLLPDPNPTRYPVFCSIPDPTRPDIEKPYPLGTARGLSAFPKKLPEQTV